MTKTIFAKLFFVALILLATITVDRAAAQTPATSTPTATPTNTPTRTPTVNTSLQQRGTRLTKSRVDTLLSTSPAAKQGNMAEVLQLGVRQIRHRATNEVALGLTDIGTVTSILAFTTSSGAGATKTLLVEGTDFSVRAGDIVPIGDHSAETWVITYRPFP